MKRGRPQKRSYIPMSPDRAAVVWRERYILCAVVLAMRLWPEVFGGG